MQTTPTILEQIKELGIHTTFLHWLKATLETTPLDHAQANAACNYTYNLSDTLDELQRTEMYLTFCAHGFPRCHDLTQVDGKYPLFYLLDLNNELDFRRPETLALAQENGLTYLLTEWERQSAVNTTARYHQPIACAV